MLLAKTGGAGVNPLSSYNYKDVGVNIDMTPRVTLEGDIILDLMIDDSALGDDKSVAGVTVPTFVQRKVTTRLRLRDGESNLLAGLLQTRELNNVQGFPGAIHVPVGITRTGMALGKSQRGVTEQIRAPSITMAAL